MINSHLTILTGASRGMGRAMAGQLIQPGRELLCISRHADAELTTLASEAGITLTQWEEDLAVSLRTAGRLTAWLQMMSSQTFDTVTLINNAGAIASPRSLSEADAGDVSNALRVGLEAPMLLTSAFLRATAAWRGERKVLNISSGLGRSAMASQAPYCAAKAGMDHFTRAVALEEGVLPNGARIVSLAPGVIDTDMQTQLRAGHPDQFPDRARFVKLQAEGQLDSPATAARKVLAYLSRADFGRQPVADVRDQ